MRGHEVAGRYISIRVVQGTLCPWIAAHIRVSVETVSFYLRSPNTPPPSITKNFEQQPYCSILLWVSKRRYTPSKRPVVHSSFLLKRDIKNELLSGGYQRYCRDSVPMTLAWATKVELTGGFIAGFFQTSYLTASMI